MPDDRPPNGPPPGVTPGTGEYTGPIQAEVASTMPVTRPTFPVAPVERFKAVPPAVFKQTLDDEIAKFNMLIDAIRSILIPGEDYGMVHRKLGKAGEAKTYCPHSREQMMYSPDGKLISCPNCGAKHTLRKGGAEKMLRFVRVSVRYTIDREAADIFQAAGIQGVVPLICTGTDLESGVTVLEGKGSATLKANDNDPNKTLKMAKKSSMIDACLGLGLSSVFTQDIDSPADYKQDGEAPAPPAPSTPNGQPVPEDAFDRRTPPHKCPDCGSAPCRCGATQAPGHRPAPAGPPAKPAGASTGKVFMGTEGQPLQIDALSKGDVVRAIVDGDPEGNFGRLTHVNATVLMSKAQGARQAPPWPPCFRAGALVDVTVAHAMMSKNGNPLLMISGAVSVEGPDPAKPAQPDPAALAAAFGPKPAPPAPEDPKRVEALRQCRAWMKFLGNRSLPLEAFHFKLDAQDKPNTPETAPTEALMAYWQAADALDKADKAAHEAEAKKAAEEPPPPDIPF